MINCRFALVAFILQIAESSTPTARAKYKKKPITMMPTIPTNIDVGGDSFFLTEESNESVRLINRDTESQPSDGSSASGSPQDADFDLWNEMDAPWPATFERAISLLASPVINANKAKDLTKSPKPGNTPVAIRRRMMVSRLIHRIFYPKSSVSPDPHILYFDPPFVLPHCHRTDMIPQRNDRIVQILLNLVA